MNSQPKVFLVDDDPAIRDSLSLSLETVGLIVESYSCAQEFLDAYRPEQAGCLVLDVRMPTMGGLELQTVLVAKKIRIPIIFISGHGDIPTSVKAIKGGAVDFLEKPFKKEILLARILEALTEDARTRQGDAEKAAIQARFAHLTPREREVIALVVTGKSNKEIARQLAISHRTVETHRARIMEKMAANSLASLVAMATTFGIPD
jgi:RNA polymerase sigma factor (sigma-70 family)